MAWVLGVGMVDPRPGNKPNQPMAITQSWEPTSELWWDLGLRWHPELATKWATGGGQFAVSQISTEKPVKGEQTIEEAAEETLTWIASEHPEWAQKLREIHDVGTDAERQALLQNYQRDIERLMTMKKYIEGQTKKR